MQKRLLNKLIEIDGFNGLRKLEVYDPEQYAGQEDKTPVNLSSNDYLGISSNISLIKNFFSAVEPQKNMMGSTSSRLLTGNFPEYGSLELLLSKLYNKEACLIFNSGYHANTGILSTLAGKDDLIIADKLIHASIIDSIKLAKCHFYRYRHLEYEHLVEYLRYNRHKYQDIYIVTESVFSMDGDLADLKALTKIKNDFNAYLYVDEAHAFGVFGEKGLGLAEKQGCINDIDFLIGTFSKAIASCGAFLVCNSIVKEYLVNFCRPLIYTTALPRINLAWTEFIILKLPGFRNERKKILKYGNIIRDSIKNNSCISKGESQIVPLIVGSNEDCIAISAYFYKKGFLCKPIRFPSVPEGTARLRISISANLNDRDINTINQIITTYYANKEVKS